MAHRTWLLGAAGVLALAAPTVIAPAAAQATGIIARAGGMETRQGDNVVRVTALTDDILRVTIARGTQMPEDASWAV
ncbi:hypothetical protein, partial [Sphingomonas aerophila]